MAVTYMTEILLIVTLNNQFTSPYKTMHFTVPMQRGLCFTLIETLLPIVECDVRGKYTKRRVKERLISSIYTLNFETKSILSDRA